MTDGDALLRAIIESPDEDTPRLVYADQLDENGEHDRADFIRVQCQLEQLLRVRADRHQLEYRARQLLCISERVFRFEGHLDERLEQLSENWISLRGWAWVGGLPEAINHVGFRRGFIEEVGMSGRAFMTCAEEMFARAPVRHVTFSRTPTALLPILMTCPHLERLRSACFSEKAIGRRGAELLANCAFLSRLEALDLTHCHIGDEGLEALATSPHLTRLSALELWGNELGESAARLLLSAPNFSRLAHLRAGRNFFPVESQRKLEERFGDRVFALSGES
jgi:uncharacterized protein (TIGR02996 family)